jgi:hypothetical protein
MPESVWFALILISALTCFSMGITVSYLSQRRVVGTNG